MKVLLNIIYIFFFSLSIHSQNIFDIEHSEIYADYLWMSATLKYHRELFSYAIELQSAGLPENTFEQDSRIWLRFVRRI